MPGWAGAIRELQEHRAGIGQPRTGPGTQEAGEWQSTLAYAGRHFLDHGDYPPSHFLARMPEAPEPVAQDVNAQNAPVGRAPKARVTPEVDSPAQVRKKGYRPRGDGLRGDDPDPWDHRIMISVKEAAWLLSVSEGMIREAVATGDVERVFIGAGTTNYRVATSSNKSTSPDG